VDRDDDDDDDDEMIGADDCNTLTAGCDNTNKLIIKNSCDKLNTGKIKTLEKLKKSLSIFKKFRKSSLEFRV